MGGFILGIIGNLVASAIGSAPLIIWHHRSMVRHVRRPVGSNSDVVAEQTGS